MSPARSIPRARTSIALATLLAAVVLLPLLGHKPLAAWDEAIYANVSREMLRSPLVPLFNGRPWFEKPPLFLWLTTLCFRLFGLSAFSARLVSALSGVATVSVLHAFALQRRSANAPLTAWLSTLILLATLGFERLAHVGETDLLLVFTGSIALVGLSLLQQHKPQGWYIFWVALAAAVLAKGAAAAPLALTALFFPKATRLTRPFWLGLAAFLTLVLPWPLFMLHRFGRPFLADCIGFHVITRSTQAIEGHHTHPWYYLWVLLITAAPFVLLYPFALAAAFRRHRDLRPWAIFSLLTLIFFSLVQTRLPHYIAPLYPALSLLTAVFLADRLPPALARLSFPTRTTQVAAVLAAILLCVASAALTRKPRLYLRATYSTTGALLHEDIGTLAFLQSAAFAHLPPGPLLLWRNQPDDQASSIASLLFYARRQVIPVAVTPLALDHPTPYVPAALPLEPSVTAQPSLILLDRDLLPTLPATLTFAPIAGTPTLLLGTVLRRAPAPASH